MGADDRAAMNMPDEDDAPVIVMPEGALRIRWS